MLCCCSTALSPAVTLHPDICMNCRINMSLNFIVCMFEVFSVRTKTKPTFFLFVFVFLHSSQKRAKKIEGDSIYIRHSLLMLEVCICFLFLFFCWRCRSPACLFLLFSFGCFDLTLACGTIHTLCICEDSPCVAYSV